MKTTDILITDFTHPLFQAAFKAYFAELGVQVTQWDKLFREMTGERRNSSYLRMAEDGSVVGFIQFTPSSLSDWFFEMPVGFIREFWVHPMYRGQGHGTALLELAEAHFRQNGIQKTILTTDTAEDFYLRRGYGKDTAIRAKNKDDVFIKKLHL